MADTLRAVLSSNLVGTLVKDATTSPSSLAQNRKRVFSAYNKTSQVFDGTTVPAITKAVDLSKTLSGANYDFDLTAAPKAEDTTETVDLTGLKLLILQINCAVGNAAGGITLGPHPTLNGYSWCGSGIIPVFYPGYSLLIFPPPLSTLTVRMPAVDATHKALRLAGTAADVIEAIAYFGT